MYDLTLGDCRTVMAEFAPDSIDAIVCDPPYGLEFMGKAFDTFTGADLDPGLCHWLAGFTDGEGCFSVHKKHINGCETYDCQFTISLRADDKPILERLHREIGIGTIAEQQRPPGNPIARWSVSSKADCVRLRDIFRAFPLRAKKAGDFELWSEALDEWLRHEQGEWDGMADARQRLMTGRAFAPQGIRIDPFQMWSFGWARQAYRVLKPGSYLVAFGGTRTYHRLTCAIEDAGFEIRDSVTWLYGSGFPKSLDVAKAIEKTGTQTDEWNGWGTALKPAHEPIVVARKPLSEKTVAANVLVYGTGAMHIDACRIRWGAEGDNSKARRDQGYSDAAKRALCSVAAAENASGFSGAVEGSDSTGGRWPANVVLSHSDGCVPLGEKTVTSTGHTPATRGPGGVSTSGHAGQHGLVEHRSGTETVVAFECVAGCPVAELDAQSGVSLSTGGRTANISKTSTIYGSGKGLGQDLEPDAVRGDPGFGDRGGASRFFYQCAPDCPVAALDEQSGLLRSGNAGADGHHRNKPESDEGIYGGGRGLWTEAGPAGELYGDTGGASRFFGDVTDDVPFRYCAKASRSERSLGVTDTNHVSDGPMAGRGQPGLKCRICGRWKVSGSPCVCGEPDFEPSAFVRPSVGNFHPTVKPVALMRWLCRLVTRPGGVVLDPFMGSGTTGVACIQEGFVFLGIESDAGYLAIAEARLAHAESHLAEQAPLF